MLEKFKFKMIATNYDISLCASGYGLLDFCEAVIPGCHYVLLRKSVRLGVPEVDSVVEFHVILLRFGGVRLTSLLFCYPV